MIGSIFKGGHDSLTSTEGCYSDKDHYSLISKDPSTNDSKRSELNLSILETLAFSYIASQREAARKMLSIRVYILYTQASPLVQLISRDNCSTLLHLIDKETHKILNPK